MCSKYFGNMGKCFSCKLRHTNSASNSSQLILEIGKTFLLSDYEYKLLQLVYTAKLV